MSVFGYEKFLRSVSHNGQEIILFDSPDRGAYFIDVSPRGTMMKMRVKRVMIWVFKNLPLILAGSIVASALIMSIVDSYLWLFLIVAGGVIALTDWSMRSDFRKTMTEFFFGKRKEKYFNHSIRLPRNRDTGNMLVNHLMSVSQEEFIEVSEKFIEREKIQNAMTELEQKIRKFNRDSEVFDYAETKLEELQKLNESSEEKFYKFIEELKRNKEEAEERDLFETVVKVEKLLVA